MSPGASMRPTWAVIIVTCALLLAGCQSSTNSPSATTTPGARPPSEAPSSEAANCVAPPTVCNGPLQAGDYVSDGTGAHVTFSLDEHDWSGSQDEPDEGFALFLADVPEGGIYVVRFAGEVFADPCADAPGDAAPLDPNPASFVGYLAGLTGMTGNAPVELEVAGAPALQVDVAFDYQAACPGGTGRRPCGCSRYRFTGTCHRPMESWTGSRGGLGERPGDDLGERQPRRMRTTTTSWSHGAELLDTMAISPLD